MKYQLLRKKKFSRYVQDEEIDGIISIASDVAVPVMAHVADKMNLPGNSLESSVWSTNKNEMRKRFAEHNLPFLNFVKSQLFKMLKILSVVLMVILSSNPQIGWKPWRSVGAKRALKNRSYELGMYCN